ncbi:MAG: HAD family phosphatase [Candidatus Woesearchaeota archaeon]
MIKAILFDWNGVIVDDLGAVSRANCDVIKELGGETVTAETWFKEIKQDWHQFFFDHGVAKKDIDKALPLMKRFYPKYEEYIKLTRNAKQALDQMKKAGLKIAILSSVDTAGIEFGLKKFGIKEYFDFVISGEDIIKPKPHPEGLQKAIALFNLKPEEILYVDDMSTIFSQAKALGMTTIGFKSALSDAGLNNADHACERFEQILALIQH